MPIRILIVDDNRDILRIYHKELKKKIHISRTSPYLSSKKGAESIDVDEADTVPLALEKLKSEAYEILVVDLKITGSDGDEMGGLELISISQGLNPLRPIIAITGYGSIALARKTLTQGVFDFIEKTDTAVDDLIVSVQKP